MNIYISHPTAFDFHTELYQPIRNSKLNSQHTIALPHEHSDNQFDSKSFFKTCDLIVAEVSYSSTGQGIELGWANLLHVPIICLYKHGAKFSGALKVISDTFIEYENQEDMIAKLTAEIKKMV